MIAILVKCSLPGAMLCPQGRKEHKIAGFVVPDDRDDAKEYGKISRDFIADILEDDSNRWVAVIKDASRFRVNGPVAYTDSVVPSDNYIIKDLNWFFEQLGVDWPVTGEHKTITYK